MTIQNKSVNGAEHDWYATRSGLPANATLNAHKANYFISKGFGSNATIRKPVSQMENDWLASIGTSTANGLYDLWVNVCQKNSVTVGRSVDECKFNFYTTIDAGTNP